jgi:hypothetical protein
MTDKTIHAGDSFVIEVTVDFDSGATVSNLSGATLRASASRIAGRTTDETVDGSTSIAGNVATCTWAANTLTAGSWRVQLRATKSGQTQTVYPLPGEQAIVTVLPANPAAS